MATAKGSKPVRTSTRKSAPTAAQQRASSERAAAARARLESAQRRRRLVVVGSSVLAVVVVVVALVVAKVVIGGPKSGQKATGASDSVQQLVSSVPDSTLNTVGVGTINSPPKALSNAPALTDDGKPMVLYAGAEYCPYCAAERWPLVVALSRFGSFSNLGQTSSAPKPEVYPNTSTLSFHGATYTSSAIAFTGKELQTNQIGSDGQYTALDKLNSDEQKLFDTYNAPPYVPADSKGSIPFADIGGKYMISGASYNPQVLQGKSHEEIAKALSDPSSDIAKAVDGTANVITAAICDITSQKPTNVCTAAGVKAGAAKLKG